MVPANIIINTNCNQIVTIHGWSISPCCRAVQLHVAVMYITLYKGVTHRCVNMQHTACVKTPDATLCYMHTRMAAQPTAADLTLLGLTEESYFTLLNDTCNYSHSAITQVCKSLFTLSVLNWCGL